MAQLPSVQIQSREVLDYPDIENISLEKKQQPEYNRKNAQALYSDYTNNRTDITEGLSTYFDTLRLFGSGKQTPEQYKNFMSGITQSPTGNNVFSGIDFAFLGDKKSNREGWLNIIWKVMSPIPLIETIAKALFSPVDYDIKAETVDIDSGAEEESTMLDFYSRSQLKPLFDSIDSMAGIPSSRDSIIIGSLEEFEKIKSDGGFKPVYITAVEKALRHIENLSKWDRVLKEKEFEDMFRLGYGFSRICYDHTTGIPIWKYADPKDVAIQYSRYNNFEDVEKFGVFEYINLSEIMSISNRIHTDDTQKYITDLELQEIARKYSGYMNNPAESEWANFGHEISSGKKDKSACKICVFHTYWMDVEKESSVEYTTKNGKKRTFKYEGKKLSEKEKLKTTRRRPIYRCSWIVGTEWVYDYGLMPNQTNVNEREYKMPIAGARVIDSIVDRLIPIAHMFAICWFRFINAISKAQADGYAINLSMLSDISDGENAYKVTDLIKMFRQENIFLYEGGMNGTGMGGNGIPINKIPGTLQEDIAKELMIMDSLNQKIEQLTGLSPVSLGATPNPNAPVGTTEMSLTSSQKAIQPLMEAVMSIKEQLAIATIPMLINIMSADNLVRDNMARVIGEECVEALLASRRNFIEYGIRLFPRPTQEDNNFLLSLAQASIQKRNAGVAGITEAEFIWLKYILNNGGNYLDVYAKYDRMIKKDEDRIKKEKEDMIRLQGEQNTQLAQTQGQQALMAGQQQLITDIKREQGKTMSEVFRNNNDAENNILKMRIQKALEKGEDITALIDELRQRINGTMAGMAAQTQPPQQSQQPQQPQVPQ
jgi:hypothetical protein